MPRECCATCRYIDEHNPDYDFYCDYRGEEIDDPQDETCFDWEAPDADEEELLAIDEQMLRWARG